MEVVGWDFFDDLARMKNFNRFGDRGELREQEVPRDRCDLELI